MKVRLSMKITQDELDVSEGNFQKARIFNRATQRENSPIKLVAEGGILFGEYESEWSSADLSNFWGYLDPKGIDLEIIL